MSRRSRARLYHPRTELLLMMIALTLFLSSSVRRRCQHQPLSPSFFVRSSAAASAFHVGSQSSRRSRSPSLSPRHCRIIYPSSESHKRPSKHQSIGAVVSSSSSSRSSSSSSSASSSPVAAAPRQRRPNNNNNNNNNRTPSKSSSSSSSSGGGSSGSAPVVVVVVRGVVVDPDETTATGHSSSSSSSTSSSSRRVPHVPRVILKRTKQSLSFRNGTPLVFAKAIDAVEIGMVGATAVSKGEPPLGALVEIVVPVDSGSNNDNGSSSSSSKPSSYTSLGFGVYNPHSLYRVRILCHRYLHPQLHQQLVQIVSSSTHEPIPPSGGDVNGETRAERGINAILRHHLQVSLQKRRAIQLLPPNARTNAFRLVNGEGDSLSGLAIELLLLSSDEETSTQIDVNSIQPPAHAIAIVMSSAGWCQVHRQSIERAIQEMVSKELEPSYSKVEVVWKTTPSRLVQDGWQDNSNNENDDDAVEEEDDDERSDLYGSPMGSKSVIIRENGVLYRVEPWSDGQKTSVYCDQRENRHMVAQLCANKRVLDLCCYHGGFALSAIVNGHARSCTAVDSSQPAIDALRENVRLNHVDPDQIELVCSDITTFLQQSCHGNPSRQYDVVILDPPKLAPTVSGLDKARRKYHGLNRDAIKVINAEKGGLLLTCTCSAAMTQKDGGRYFLDMVSGAALAANRCATLLRVTGAAFCHTQSPVAFPAGSYLTAALFYVHPTKGSGADAYDAES